MKKIFFHEHDIKSFLLYRTDLKGFLIDLFKKEGYLIERIDVIFCSDKYLLSLNKKFLNHNYYTDTLSFILSEPGNPLIGEVYISTDTVRQNASVLNIGYQNELIRIIIHGCLHLCGYFDKPKKASDRMKNLQEKYLIHWFVSRETRIGG